MTSCLVIGGSGFIGSRIARALTRRGDEVRIFDLLPPAPDLADCAYLRGDVRDQDALRAALAGIDCVHHNAAQLPVAQKNTRTAGRLMEEVNVLGTLNALSAARAAGVAKMVFTSSSAIYGLPASCPIDDRTVPRPIEDYGRTKLAAERYCDGFAADGLDVSIVRPPPVMGDGRLGVFQILFDWISRGYNIPVLGRGDNLHQWIHVDDCVDACLRAGDRAGVGCYNIGAPAEHTLRQLLESLIQHAGSPSKVRSFPKRLAEAGIMIGSWLGVLPIGPFHALTYGETIFADVELACRELGWQARHDQFAMLCQAFNWYMAHRDEVAERRTGSQHQRAPAQRLLRLGRFIP